MKTALSLFFVLGLFFASAATATAFNNDVFSSDAAIHQEVNRMQKEFDLLQAKKNRTKEFTNFFYSYYTEFLVSFGGNGKTVTKEQAHQALAGMSLAELRRVSFYSAKLLLMEPELPTKFQDVRVSRALLTILEQSAVLQSEAG